MHIDTMQTKSINARRHICNVSMALLIHQRENVSMALLIRTSVCERSVQQTSWNLCEMYENNGKLFEPPANTTTYVHTGMYSHNIVKYICMYASVSVQQTKYVYTVHSCSVNYINGNPLNHLQVSLFTCTTY